MRRVAAAELCEVFAWLQCHAVGTVFLESNLRNHGLAENSEHPRSVWLWAAHEGRGFIGLSRAGVLMPQMALAETEDWAGVGAALAGRAVSGLNGTPDQVAQALDATGLSERACTLDHDEPGFALALSDLVMPRVAGLRLAAMRESDMPLMADWRAAYMTEIMGTPPDIAPELAALEIDSYRRADSHRILWREGLPVAFTGFNARLPDLVQIGGVYTPPALRGQGLARAAVALHLTEAKAQGIARATLFAASDMAARAYQAIGFRPVGRVRLLIFATSEVVA